MRLVQLTGFHSSKPIFINPDYVISVFTKNSATEVVLAGGTASSIQMVLEPLEEVVKKLTAPTG